MNRILLFFFLIILFFSSVFIFLFDGWNFTKPLYYNVFWATHFAALTFTLALLLSLKFKNAKIFLIVIAFLISVLIFVGQFHIIDAFEYPRDIKVLSKSGNDKIVIRKKKSGKTNEVVIDTVKVTDRFIFRKVKNGN